MFSDTLNYPLHIGTNVASSGLFTCGFTYTDFPVTLLSSGDGLACVNMHTFLTDTILVSCMGLEEGYPVLYFFHNFRSFPSSHRSPEWQISY